MTKINRYFMRKAYEEAFHAIGLSDPNPAVGAVLVKNNKILAKGSTMPVGLDHAEIVAIQYAQKKYGKDITDGATLYVSLEPCCHYGKKPPCVDQIIKSGISDVYIDQIDISEKVNGKGIQILKKNGINVNLSNNSAFRLEKLFTLDPFLKLQNSGFPLCILKWAQTKEGWLAPLRGASGLITSKATIEIVHRLRHFFRAGLVTPGTVAIDWPRMNVRANLNQLKQAKAKDMQSYLFTELIQRYEIIRNQDVLEMLLSLKNYRYFILPPSWGKNNLIKFYNQQVGLDKQFHLITYSELQENLMTEISIPHIRLTKNRLFKEVFKIIGAHGHNQVMIEAGPKSAEYLANSGILDVLICIKSKCMALFRGGLDFSFSRAISYGNDLNDYGYHKIMEFDYDTDTVLIFSTKRNL